MKCATTRVVYIRKVSNRPVKYKKATYQPHTDAVHADALAMRAQSLPQLDGGTHSTEVHVQPPLVGGVKAIQLVLADHAASRVLHRERACRHVESHLGTVSSVLHSSHPPRCSSTSPPTLHVDLKLCSALYRNLNRTKGDRIPAYGFMVLTRRAREHMHPHWVIEGPARAHPSRPKVGAHTRVLYGFIYTSTPRQISAASLRVTSRVPYIV